MSRIVRYFPESDLRSGHFGLKKQATGEGVDLALIGKGDFLLFVNKRQSAFKMLTSGGVLVHFKLDGAKRLHPGTFASIPNYFDGKSINYSRALEAALKEDFKAKKVYL